MGADPPKSFPNFNLEGQAHLSPSMAPLLNRDDIETYLVEGSNRDMEFILPHFTMRLNNTIAKNGKQ